MISNEITDRIILISGTSKGLGLQLAMHFIQIGYQVIGCSRSPQAFEDKSYYHKSIDLAKEDQILDLFKFIRKDFGKLDILINNAVINPPTFGPSVLPYSAAELAFKVNVIGPIMLSRESLKLMARRKFGRIVNIGSMVTKYGALGGLLYPATKAALKTFTELLARDVWSLGITVNTVSPSVLETELAENLEMDQIQRYLNLGAIPQFGNFGDIFTAIDFLISERASGITGQNLYLGGI